jgi:hypothetical protein
MLSLALFVGLFPRECFEIWTSWVLLNQTSSPFLRKFLMKIENLAKMQQNLCTAEVSLLLLSPIAAAAELLLLLLNAVSPLSERE